MKRKIVIFLIMCILCSFTSCINGESATKEEPYIDVINKSEQKILELNTLAVLMENEEYTIIIHDYTTVKKTAKFTAERNFTIVNGMTLQNFDTLKSYIGMNISQIEEIFGDPHTDIGSGFYIPTYVTTDAFLVSFSLNNDKVAGITKWDLLTGKVSQQVG